MNNLSQHIDAHTTPETIPEAPEYLWGYDLSRSGWGPYQGASDGRWSIKDLMADDHRLRLYQIPKDQLCPVVFPLFPDDDKVLLKFNMGVGDVVYQGSVERGHAGSEPDPEWLKREADKFKAAHTAYAHSIVYGFLASNYFEGLLEPYRETGLWWLMNKRLHGTPVVARSHGGRWYEDPGLGWTFFDDDLIPFKYDDPRERPKKGDYALVSDRDGSTVKLQTYEYTGGHRRYKVTPLAT
jgi:hypothetical protein